MEIPSQDNTNINPQSRMIRNRITIQYLMARQWKSDNQIQYVGDVVTEPVSGMAVFSQHAGNVVMWRVEMGGSALPTRGEHVALESVKNYRFLLVSYDAAVTRDIVLQTYQHAGDSPHPDNQRRGNEAL
ncbi:uncharacterized protein DS421_17g588070 [Arachis hypogaea]|nr:uncharacterized protein DS421_17g588070 [Arachis hypogaea]